MPLDWGDLPFFLSLMRSRSLRNAGRDLGVAATTVARRVAALEAALGTPLLVRSPSGFAPTEAARRLAESARGVESAMATVARRFAGAGGTTGTLRISVVESLASEVVAPSLKPLLRAHPGLCVHLQVDPRVVALERGEAELAVRLQKPTGKRLVMRRVAVVQHRLYGSRALLAERRDRKLSRMPFLAYDDTYGPIPEREWYRRHGLEGAIALRSGSTVGLLRATIAGAGLALLPAFLAARSDELVEVDGPAPPPQRSVYVVAHEDLRQHPAVRAGWDHLAKVFARLGGAAGAADRNESARRIVADGPICKSASTRSMKPKNR